MNIRKNSLLVLLGLIGLSSCTLGTTNSSQIAPGESSSVVVESSKESSSTIIESTGSSSIIEDQENILTKQGSYFEGIYLEWKDTSNAATVSYAKSGSTEYKTIDPQLIRYENGINRADIVGVSGGVYDVVVTTANNKTINVKNIKVDSDDRSGYAHFNTTKSIGAYNNDGTLKENATVVYVTDETKNTVTATIAGKKYTGLVSILQAQSKSSTPLDIRILGTINAATWNPISYTKGNGNLTVDKMLDQNGKALPTKSMTEEQIIAGGYNSMSKDLNNGITKLNGLTNKISYSSSEFDSYYNMCDISNAQNVTVEGIGFDAGLYQWGFTWKSCSYIEVKNLTFDDYTEDACSFEGSDDSTTIAGFKTGHIWIHNNTFNEGKNNWDVCPEQDKREGDGATDFKKNAYITLSYNHYYKNHKTGLVGGGDSQRTACITFHHNYYENCSSRLPLGRQANMHMYNNYYYKSTGTNMSIRAGALAFIENCYFESCSNPVEVKSGAGLTAAAKSYNNIFNNCKGTNAATIVSSREEKVTNQNIYDTSFDTNSSIFYYDAVNKVSKVDKMTNAEQAKEDCKTLAGVYSYNFIYENTGSIPNEDKEVENNEPTSVYIVDASTVSSGATTFGTNNKFRVNFDNPEKFEYPNGYVKLGANGSSTSNNIMFSVSGKIKVEITCILSNSEKAAQINVAQENGSAYSYAISGESKTYTFEFESTEETNYYIYRTSGTTGVQISYIKVSVID